MDADTSLLAAAGESEQRGIDVHSRGLFSACELLIALRTGDPGGDTTAARRPPGRPSATELIYVCIEQELVRDRP